jgi:SAM-dependent methyltransferase
MTLDLKRLLPPGVRRLLREHKLRAQRNMLPLDRVTDFNALRRVHPYRTDFGWHRGKCVDRYYIEQFLQAHALDIRGRTVEIGESVYTRQFGSDRVVKADVLDFVSGPEVTVRADLAHAPSLSDDSFDCFLCTQTLQYVYEVGDAVKTIFRTLTSGGVALVTLPGISQIAPKNMTGGAEDYWRFTAASSKKLFSDVFGAENVDVQSYGNVLVATALLHGLVLEELSADELEHNDPDYPVIVTVRATKHLRERIPNA